MLRLNDFSAIEDDEPLCADSKDESVNSKLGGISTKSSEIGESRNSFRFPFFRSQAKRNTLSIDPSSLDKIQVISSQSRPLSAPMSDENVKKRKIRVKDAPLLPRWMRYALFKLVGIKSHENEKPLLSLFFYVIIITSAIAFLITDVWYQVFNIMSITTKQDILTGSVQILLSLFFVQLGPISFQLIYKLYSCSVFVESVRLHAKRLFGLNASVLLVLIASLFAGNNFYGIWYQMENSYCSIVSLDVTVCKVRFFSRMTYTMLMFFWNIIVGMIVLSVCRSHTLGIRMFIRDLEDDGSNLDALWRKTVASRVKKLDESTPKAMEIPVNETLSTVQMNESGKESVPTQSESTEPAPRCLSPDDILADYRKIAARLRLTGFLIQRWIASWIAFVLLWSSDYLIYWISNDASVTGIFDFLLPLVLLPLIISSVAEVNAEGQRALRYVAPTEERIPLIWFMQSNPLQLTIYGFRLDYSAELKVIAALAIGFGSQIILREFLRV